MTTDQSQNAEQGRVSLDIAGPVAHLTFDRPQARNAMTWRMYEDLAAACQAIEKDPAVAVAVLRGAGGKAFVAGTDIAQFADFRTGDDGVAYEKRIDVYVAALESLRVPTIAVVEGFAVGGGLAIANACDVRIAATGARFGVPIARTLGNCLSPGNLRRLTATLGLPMVKRMILLAEMPTAEQLSASGYVAAVVEPANLEATVDDMTQRIVGHAPLTMRATREMLRRLATDPTESGIDLIAACYASGDFRAGVEAFTQKKAPVWSGR